MNRSAKSAEDPAFDRFVRAQQVWDRAFACRIAEVRARPNRPLVVGIIGRGHLEYRGGTPGQLADLGISDAMVLLPHAPDRVATRFRPDLTPKVASWSTFIHGGWFNRSSRLSWSQ